MQPRLLVVEDEPLLADSMADYFDAHGYRVDVAHELEEAQALVTASAYDVVITDLRLTPSAHEEGLELLAFVRQRRPRTLMLVVTAFPSARAERTARSRGACAVLHKPHSLAELERHVRSLLEHCARHGNEGACPALTAGGDVRTQDELRSFLLLLRNVRCDQTDGANAEVLRELERSLLELESAAPPSAMAQLTACLAGSAAVDQLLRDTSRQTTSGALARGLAVRIARMSIDG
jgi:DNA-binding response OmpR family regulator